MDKYEVETQYKLACVDIIIKQKTHQQPTHPALQLEANLRKKHGYKYEVILCKDGDILIDHIFVSTEEAEHLYQEALLDYEKFTNKLLH